MSTIIAGRFESSTHADEAVHRLTARSIARDAISVFYVTSPGQHDVAPLGGDEDASAGAEHAHRGAGTGAMMGAGLGAAGVIIGATAGLAAPLVAVAGVAAAAAGAYSGSLAGAMGAMMDAGQQHIRHAGMLVAVHAPDADTERDAIMLLQAAGAVDIERAEGVWEDGEWSDFDPTRAPHLVDAQPVQRASPEAI